MDLANFTTWVHASQCHKYLITHNAMHHHHVSATSTSSHTIMHHHHVSVTSTSSHTIMHHHHVSATSTSSHTIMHHHHVSGTIPHHTQSCTITMSVEQYLITHNHAPSPCQCDKYLITHNAMHHHHVSATNTSSHTIMHHHHVSGTIPHHTQSCTITMSV